nr:helix-turn-helix transcriptional regulator [Lutispora saccharofermentans]
MRIKEAREKTGITQKELSVKLNITREYLSALENGHYNPSIALLKKIAQELNTSLTALFIENQDKPRGA